MNRKALPRIAAVGGLAGALALGVGVVDSVLAQSDPGRGKEDYAEAGSAAQSRSAFSMEEMVRRLREQGYTRIDEIERENGTYEVEATNAENRRVELEIDAATGEIRKEEREDD